MATPTITNALLSKAVYAPGEKATLSFEVNDTDNKTFTITVKVTDSSNNAAETTVDLTVQDNLTSAVTDSEGRSWTKVSQNGNAQVWEATV